MRQFLHRLRCHSAATANTTQIAGTVFDIPELCEGILIHLPRNDIFRARQICKTIQSTIITSPSLRSKLFCSRSVTVKEQSWSLDRSTKTVTVRTPSEIPAEWDRPRWWTWVTPRAYNPFLFESGSYDFPRDLYSRCHNIKNLQLKCPPLLRLVKQGSIYWDMCFTQPPIRYVELSLRRSRNSLGEYDWASWAYYEVKHVVWNEDGVTVGEVIGEIERKVEEGYSYHGWDLSQGVYISPAELALVEEFGAVKFPEQSRWEESRQARIISGMIDADRFVPIKKKKSDTQGLRRALHAFFGSENV